MINENRIKEAVFKYQGKYFKGQEINGFDTYLYIKKVFGIGNSDNTFFKAYVNVIYRSAGKIVFVQNRQWLFGPYHINKYGYKKINKSIFCSVLKQCGFRINKDSTSYTVERKPISG